MYELSRHRFAELKHFCLQYDEWKHQHQILTKQSLPPPDSAVPKTAYSQAIRLIEMTAEDTNGELAQYILASVTRDVSISMLHLPCDSKTFDFYRRKFFWLLSERKGL